MLVKGAPGLIYKWDLKLVIIVPADGQTYNSAKPSGFY